MKRPSTAELTQAVQALVPIEPVLGAFVGGSGPRPGSEGLALIPGALVMMLFKSPIVGGLVVVAGFLVVTFARSYTCIARTESSLLSIHCGRTPIPLPTANVNRLPLDALGKLNDAAESSIMVGWDSYWLTGEQRDQAYRLSRLTTAD